LSHTAVHFALVILEIGSGWPEPWSFYFRLPDIAGMTGYRQTPPHPAFFHWAGGPTNIFAGMQEIFAGLQAGNCDPLYLTSQVVWNDRRMLLYPAIGNRDSLS
jgi:hypothetical protein